MEHTDDRDYTQPADRVRTAPSPSASAVSPDMAPLSTRASKDQGEPRGEHATTRTPPSTGRQLVTERGQTQSGDDSRCAGLRGRRAVPRGCGLPTVDERSVTSVDINRHDGGERVTVRPT